MELRNEVFDNARWFSWFGAMTSYGMGDMGTPGSRNSTWEAYKEVTLDAEYDSINVQVGNTLQLGFWLASQSGDQTIAFLFGNVWLPNGNPFPNNPLFGPAGLRFDIGELKGKTLEMFVPQRIEPGEYTLIGHVQDEFGNDIDTKEVIIRIVAGDTFGGSYAQSREAVESKCRKTSTAKLNKFEGE
jgi:hypothetical protein